MQLCLYNCQMVKSVSHLIDIFQPEADHSSEPFNHDYFLYTSLLVERPSNVVYESPMLVVLDVFCYFLEQLYDLGGC